jgi:hypothetical protein
VIQASAPIPREDVFRRHPTLFDEIASWFAERLHFSISGGAARILLWALVGVGVLALVALLRRFLAAGRALRSGEQAADADAAHDLAARVEALRREARAARERGELALALRRYLHALVLGMGGRGALEFREAWTNRELLARGRPSAEALAALGPVVGELEAKEYGGRDATAEDVDRLEALCERFLAGGAPSGVIRRA